MEVKAKREGCYSELKVHLEIANLVSLTKIEKLLIFQFFYSFIKILVKLKFFFCQYEMKHKGLSLRHKLFIQILLYHKTL